MVSGKVILAAAGPGDPELITLKTLRYLQQADVVLTVRLVSKTILDEYVNPAAEIVYVGKQCRRGNSTPQATINELLVLFSAEGKLSAADEHVSRITFQVRARSDAASRTLPTKPTGWMAS